MRGLQVTTGIAGAQGGAELVFGVTVQMPGRVGLVGSVVDGVAADGVTSTGLGGGVVVVTATGASVTSTGAGSGMTGAALSR